MRWLFLLLLLLPPVAADSQASFGATAIITIATFDETSGLQLTSPVLADEYVSFSLDVSYDGSGVNPVSAEKPSNYSNGLNWSIVEDGATKNVTLDGNRLRWTGNFSATNITLVFLIPAPTLTIDEENSTGTIYRKQFRIGTTNNISNVSVETSINSSYQDFILYEVENNTLVQRTRNYSLNVTDGTASFGTFNTTTNRIITFLIVGSNPIVTTTPSTGGGGSGGGSSGGGGGRSGGGFGWLDEDQPEEMPTPQQPKKKLSLPINWLDIAAEEGEPTEFSFRVWNNGTRETAIITPGSSVIEMASRIEFPPGETEIQGVVRPLPAGERRLYLFIETDEELLKLFLNIAVEAKPQEQVPEAVSQTTVPQSKPWHIIPVLIVTAILLSLVLIGRNWDDLVFRYRIWRKYDLLLTPRVERQLKETAKQAPKEVPKQEHKPRRVKPKPKKKASKKRRKSKKHRKKR